MLRFTQSFTADFEAILREETPFAFVRFGDGEAALLAGERHKSADTWATTGPTWIRGPLLATLVDSIHGYYVGLPPRCCQPKQAKALHGLCGSPNDRKTFATIFSHGNYSRRHEILDRFDDDVAIVTHGPHATIEIPENGVAEQWDVSPVVARMREERRPILLAAGPISKLLAWRYWLSQPDRDRQFVIDVGSIFDDDLHGKVSRHYHRDGATASHECQWDGRTAPVKPGRRSDTMQTRAQHTRTRTSMATTKIIQGNRSIRHQGRPSSGGTPALAPASAPGGQTHGNVVIKRSGSQGCRRCAQKRKRS